MNDTEDACMHVRAHTGTTDTHDHYDTHLQECFHCQFDDKFFVLHGVSIVILFQVLAHCLGILANRVSLTNNITKSVKIDCSTHTHNHTLIETRYCTLYLLPTFHS